MGRQKIILKLVTRNQDQEQAFIDELSANEKDQRGSLEDWSAKDMIAHVATWRARFAHDLAAARRGDQPEITTDFDHENAGIYADHHENSWTEVRALAQTSFGALIHELEYLDDQDLDRGDVLRRAGGQAAVAIYRRQRIQSLDDPSVRLL